MHYLINLRAQVFPNNAIKKMKCLLLSSKNTHWVSLNDLNTGLLPCVRQFNKQHKMLLVYKSIIIYVPGSFIISKSSH